MKYNMSDFTWRFRRIPNVTMCIVIFNIILLGFKFFSVMKFTDLCIVIRDFIYIYIYRVFHDFRA